MNALKEFEKLRANISIGNTDQAFDHFMKILADAGQSRTYAKHYDCEMCETREMMAHVPKKRHPRGYEEIGSADTSNGISGLNFAYSRPPSYGYYTYHWDNGASILETGINAPNRPQL